MAPETFSVYGYNYGNLTPNKFLCFRLLTQGLALSTIQGSYSAKDRNRSPGGGEW